MFYYIVAASNDGYYILNESNEIIATTDTTSTGTVIKYKYDATNPTCEKVATVGIYLKETDKYIKLTSDGKGKYISKIEVECTEAYIGEMTNGGFCNGKFGGENPVPIQFTESEEPLKMFVQHKKGSLFNLRPADANYYAVLVNKDYIMFNANFNGL